MIALNLSPLLLAVSWSSLLLLFSQAQNLQLGEWQQIIYTSTTEMSRRSRHAGAFLSSTNEYLVFGGWIAGSLGDFHSINISSLQSRLLEASRPLRRRYYMAYTSDLVSNFYVHGGWNVTLHFNDLRRFNVQTRDWTQLSSGPSVRRLHCLEWDQVRDRLILFGGSAPGVFFNDLWTYSIESDQWQEVTPVGSPTPYKRRSHACAFNTQLSTFHVQGGTFNDSEYYQDLCQFNFTSNKWTLIDDGNSNVQRTGHSMRYSKSLNSLLLFFGRTFSPLIYTKTIYQFSFNTPSVGWTLFQDSGSEMPSERNYVSPGFNPLNDEYFVFGGWNGDSFFRDLWKIRIEDANANISGTTPSSNTITNTQTPDLIASTASQSSSKVGTTSTLFRSSYAQTLTKPEPVRSTFRSFVQANIPYLIAGGSILVIFTTSLCIWCITRSRDRRSQIAESKTASRGNPSLPVSSVSNETSGTLTSRLTSMSSSTSSSSTTSYTEVSTELGLSVPGYLQIDFAKSVRITSVLAEGGFGTVSIAQALIPKLNQYGDQVIVKQPKQSRISDRTIQLFNQEISLMEYFKSEKYIAKLLGYSTDPFCLVMKYYPMGSLTRVIKMTENRCKIHVIAFSRDIANGLWAMHRKGVVHNDLKTDNVLVDTSSETGQPFCILSDLGISQIVTQQILKVGEFKVFDIRALSIAYAAPERIYSFRKKIDVSFYDQKTLFSWDVYALGIVMFEILTGKTKLYN